MAQKTLNVKLEAELMAKVKADAKRRGVFLQNWVAAALRAFLLEEGRAGVYAGPAVSSAVPYSGPVEGGAK